MSETAPSRYALSEPIVNLRSGLAIYKTNASPYYYARIWIPSEKKRKVFSTKATTKIEAVQRAEELFASLGSRGHLNAVPADRTFARYSEKLIKSEQKRGERRDCHRRTWQVSKGYLENKTWGLHQFFGDRDITKIGPRDFYAYVNWLDQQDCDLGNNTRNKIAHTFRKVMNLAFQEGVIDVLPVMPRAKRKDNPRTFFQFFPLVSIEDDEVKLLLETAGRMASESVTVRGTLVTRELSDFIHFMLVSFLRPTEGEIYNLRHRDIRIPQETPIRLILNVPKGKTGARTVQTMPRAVQVYQEICKRVSPRKDAFVFMPEYENRETAKRVVQRQFNALLDRCGLKVDKRTGIQHVVYSLRHTAICMRLVWSQRKANDVIADNAGTSVDQIKRFYAAHLPLDKFAAQKLQKIGTDLIGMSDQCDYG